MKLIVGIVKPFKVGDVKDALNKLEHDETVSLIETTGLPKWKNVVIGAPSFGTHPEDGVCQVTAQKAGYLLHAPQKTDSEIFNQFGPASRAAGVPC